MLKRVLPYCIALSLIFAFHPQPVQAETLFEDHFDTDTLENWTVVRNFSWLNTAQPCQNASQPALWQVMLERLGIRIDGPGCYTEIIPKTFTIPAEQGYVFEFDMTMPESTNMDRGYTIRYFDLNHGYGVKVLANEISLGKGIAGAAPIPRSVATYPFEANHTYHMRNELGADNSIKIFVDEHLVINTVDIPPFSTGGTIGFQGSVGSLPVSEVWFDNVKVSTLSDPRDTILDAPYYSQRDPSWAEDYYDTAKDWADKEKTTVERWGCALTSAVMILKYHNITDISPDITITPSTLNTWLISQPDGYVGKGLVNWIAITRLTKEFHDLHASVPSLEFRYGEISRDEAKEQLDLQQPFIVELPKHFVLARGIQYVDHALIIHDPLTTKRTTLPTTDDTKISSRLFTPSFTDLSYILVAHDSSTNLELYNPDGSVAPSHIETIEDDRETANETSAVLHQVAKPNDGTYVLSVNETSDGNIQLYFYDKDGQVQTETLDAKPGMYLLHYMKQGHTTVTQVSAHGEFVETLRYHYKNKNIHSAKVFYQLQSIGQYFGNTSEEAAKSRYKSYLRTLLEEHRSSFEQEARNELLLTLY